MRISTCFNSLFEMLLVVQEGNVPPLYIVSILSLRCCACGFEAHRDEVPMLVSILCLRCALSGVCSPHLLISYGFNSLFEMLYSRARRRALRPAGGVSILCLRCCDPHCGET